MADLAESLAQRLASSATGYGAVIDGVLNIRTVTETANAAALNAFHATGVRLRVSCQNPDCDCLVQLLQRHRPNISIVPVSVAASHG